MYQGNGLDSTHVKILHCDGLCTAEYRNEQQKKGFEIVRSTLLADSGGPNLSSDVSRQPENSSLGVEAKLRSSPIPPI